VSLPSGVATSVGAAPPFMPRFFGFVSRPLIGPAPASMLAASPHRARQPGKTMTKTHRTRRALAAALALCCGAAAAHDDARECTARTLSGSYVFSASGWGAATGVWQPEAIVEFIRFNGDGTLSVLAATVANPAGNGAIVQAPPGGTGTHALEPGCTGTLSFTNGPSFSLVAAPKSNELRMIQTNPNNVLQGTVTRIGP
jgi:hypothetical protein